MPTGVGVGEGPGVWVGGGDGVETGVAGWSGVVLAAITIAGAMGVLVGSEANIDSSVGISTGNAEVAGVSFRVLRSDVSLGVSVGVNVTVSVAVPLAVAVAEPILEGDAEGVASDEKMPSGDNVASAVKVSRTHTVGEIVAPLPAARVGSVAVGVGESGPFCPTARVLADRARGHTRATSSRRTMAAMGQPALGRCSESFMKPV